MALLVSNDFSFKSTPTPTQENLVTSYFMEFDGVHGRSDLTCRGEGG